MPISPQERKYHNTHNRNITQAEARIDGAFAEVVQGVTRIYQLYDFTLPEGGAFQFEQATPAARKAADKVFANMRKRILETIQAGADAADKLSQQKAEKLTRLYGAATQLRREQTTARSLQEISDAVWKQSEQLRAEMELALSVALKSGTSADDFSREIRGYLNEPNKLFRRVRDEFGNLVLSKAAAAYHPGRGVYRSSYKNARRLAATEINMAYRKADYDRWQKLDFVIGVRIALSKEHPYYDMCDELAGDYPKDFVFVGWHPHCRCIATPILQNIEDFKNGVPPEEDLFKVNKVPDNFNKWVLNNEIRINRALSGQSTMPFFLRDNKGAMERALGIEGNNAIQKKIESRLHNSSRKEYLNMSHEWNKHYFDEQSGGYVVIHQQRLAASQKSKNERAKLEKERNMCVNYARIGFRIKMLEEIAGVSSADVICNEVLAELKSVESSKKIIRRAKEGKGQGAEIILFELHKKDEEAYLELDKLQHKYGISFAYYFKENPQEITIRIMRQPTQKEQAE